MQNLMNNLTKLFQKDERIFADGKLLKNKLTELALKLDQSLIELLLSDNKAKEHFFIEKTAKKDKVLVFDKDKFIAFVNNKEFLPDSFTSFKNKIGLMSNGDYLKEKGDVVLAWAYKDCVLEGGQDKEDQKRDEIFYNETLSPDEIDRLFEPKVFTNAKRVDKKGPASAKATAGKEHKFDGFRIDENGNIKDNLIIKGNNLLALHSLKKRFVGKVKLIYIDPPYNTGNDSFGYNDRFNHSSWLTFMKNRLEVARELLSNEGFLFVHISTHEYAYLKVLLDELNQMYYAVTFNLLVRHPERILKKDKDYHDVIEYLLVYTKKRENKISKKVTQNNINEYTYKIKELRKGKVYKIGKRQVEYFEPKDYKVVAVKPSEEAFKRISIRGSIKEGNSSGRFYEKHLRPIQGKFKPGTLFKVEGIGNDSHGFRYFHTPEEGNVNGGYYQGIPTNWTEEGVEPYPNFIDLVKDFNAVGYEGDVQFRNAKKPESLIKKIIEIAGVRANEIVLDFFAGSGTTGATAHKTGCRYILVEQMEEQIKILKERLKKVIKGEDGGISKSVGWKGGGDFVYMELAKWNEEFITEIKEADTTRKLLNIYEKMKKEAFFRYDVDLSKFEEKEFEKLPLKEQKQVLCECLDKNHLYVNLSEMDDATYKVSADDKKLNKEFYKTVV